MGPYFYYYDPTYILVFIGVILSLLASAKVKSTFSKYSNVRSMSGMTGAEAAQKILHRAGIYDVGIERTRSSYRSLRSQKKGSKIVGFSLRQ